MGSIISVFNQKGGIGKTTTVLNLGWAFINSDKKVLMIDFDPQASLTISMDMEPKLMKTVMYDVLHGADILKAMATDYENFYFIPNSVELAAAEQELFKKPNTLKNVLQPIRDMFDFILIDCPPSLGNLSINALTASDGVIVPMQTQYLCWEGYELLTDTIDICKKLNPELKILGILPTMHKNTNHSNGMLEVINNTGLAFKTIIPDRVAFQDCTVNGVPIFNQDKKLGELYIQLMQEVMEREGINS
jgi:chromosome partitioning protein